MLGTPCSGKSFGIIDPFIRQHAAKGFSMVVYDYKFPALARNLFYQYCKNKKKGSLPKNCGFRIVNFTDIEYSNRVNPIQRKYIPDLAAASETAATLLSSLNKGGGEKKGGSEAFFQNSAENFLAAIIYFFVNFHPTGYKNGKKLNRYVLFDGRILRLVISLLVRLLVTSPQQRGHHSAASTLKRVRSSRRPSKTDFNMAKIKKEESLYRDLPKIYAFKSQRDKEIMLNRNFARVNDEVESMVQMLLGKGNHAPEG